MCPGNPVPVEPHVGSGPGLRCPGLSFYCTVPQHAAHPLDPTPPRPPSLSHACPPFAPPPRPGAVEEPEEPGPGLQPAGSTQGAVAAVAAGYAPPGEARRFGDLGASSVPVPPSLAEVASVLRPPGRPKAISVSFLPLSSAWRGTLCGFTLRTEQPPPSTCHPEPGMLCLG